MKKLNLTIFLFFIAVSFVEAQGIAGQIDNIYSTYVRPILASLCVIMIVVGGIANMGKIREGGEASKSAMMNWGMMVLWPVIVFGAAEIAKGILL